MLPLKPILVAIALMLIVGSSGVLNIVQNGVYTIACGGCDTGFNAFYDSVSMILTAGQHDVTFGVNGLLALDKTMKNSSNSTIMSLGLTQTVVQGVYWFYWVKIILGSFLTLVYLWGFVWIINKAADSFVGFPPPLAMTLIVAFVLVGLMHFVFTGFTEVPFQGWIGLVMHPELWQAGALDYVAPVPIDLSNVSATNVSLP